MAQVQFPGRYSHHRAGSWRAVALRFLCQGLHGGGHEEVLLPFLAITVAGKGHLHPAIPQIVADQRNPRAQYLDKLDPV